MIIARLWLEKKIKLIVIRFISKKKARFRIMTEAEKNVQRAHNCALSHNLRSIE